MNTERITLVAQLVITILFIVGFFGCTLLVTLGRASIPVDQIRLADTLYGGLIAIMVQVSAYWFARQRNAVADAAP